MQQTLIKSASCVLLISMLACGGPKKALISEAEISNAQGSGNLPALYQKATRLVAQGKDKEQALALQSQIAKLLVAQESGKTGKLLAQHSKQPGSVCRKTLLGVKKNIAPMQQWSAPAHKKLNAQIKSALAEVNSLIAKAITTSKQENINKVDKIFALKEAARLAGDGQQEAISYQKEYEAALAQYFYVGGDALQKRLFNTAVKSAESALELDPGNVQFESMLSQAQAGLFEKDFRFALESGKPESAYLSLLEVADKPIFLQLKKSMGKNILFLANYFAGAAKQAYTKGDLASAYTNFKRGRDIQQKLSISQAGFVEEKTFLDLVMEKARKVDFGDGKRQALLRIVNEFDLEYPGLKSEYLKLTKQVKSRAMTKLAISEFKELNTGEAVVTSVGRRISSKLEKILFDRLGNELLIVTSVAPAKELGFEGLALKVQGDILQAAIERSKNTGQRSKMVQVGSKKTETEAYRKWAKRENGEAPKRFDVTPVMQEVVLTVEHQRKQSVAEASMKIIEPATGKILLTDTFVEESEFSGESINEYQKGDFHQPYVRADLPSDIKVMDSLAGALAVKLGDKLTQYLQNPEQVFYHKYIEAKAQGKHADAIEFLANALTIAESKGKPSDDWYAELKAAVMQ